MNFKFRFRRGTTQEWLTVNPVLMNGEPGVEFLEDGTTRLKIGDGVTTWSLLDYVNDILSYLPDPVNDDDGLVPVTFGGEYVLQSPEAASGGMPFGGNTGQFITKTSPINYDAEWTSVIDGGTFN